MKPIVKKLNPEKLKGKKSVSDVGKQVDIATELSPKQQEAFDVLNKTNQNVFIQGQAGSGKSSFIMYLKEHLNKRILLCAPTAIAAMNVGGVTLHSLFKLPVSDFITDEGLNQFKYMRKPLREILNETDVIIIDEISMVRPDMLDAIDMLCRDLRRNPFEFFGGLQIVLIGDAYQLPPVITQSAAKIFEEFYNTDEPYFFDAISYREGNFKKIEFDHVYRQNDTELLDKLSQLRLNKNTQECINYFNTCKITDKELLKTAVTITPYKSIAEDINKQKIKELNTKAFTYEAGKTGSFKKTSNYPALDKLTLKEGALVIFTKNDDQWINGTTGIVTHLSENSVFVKILSTGLEVCVRRAFWDTKEYKVDKKTKKVIEEVTGTFTQYPLQLGYGLTIHRAQGKTLDKVNIDIGRGAFAHGQLYVALSRTRNKADINLTRNISTKDVIISKRVVEFMNK